MIDFKELKLLTKELTVLYAEDDPFIQKIMVKYLKKLFLNVVVANDGVEGLKEYKLQNIDIIITDISMPKMNGLNMLKNIKEINKDQPIIITSAHSESKYMYGAIKMGIDGYILKPFDYEQLNKELYKIANRLKKFSENEQYKKNLKVMVKDKVSELNNAKEFQNYNYKETLLSMAKMIEDRDIYTAGHSKRVAKYSVLIAKSMGYSEDNCEKLYQAGLLHDIGKIVTPDAVLLSPKRLNNTEYKLIQEHAGVGFNFLNNIPMFSEFAEVVHQHHERYDGKGYPNGLKANEITPLARIMIVADAFDAMTTNRIYKAGRSVAEALDELEKFKFKQFHPEVVDKAVVVLRDIKIDNKINQLPKTKIEEERFAYFYKDNICKVYNQDYLDVVLIRNSYENKYKYMNIFLVKNFSSYNQKNSWSKGNKLLLSIATCLDDYFKSSIVFRVFGDDFIVMCEEKISLDNLKKQLNTFIEDSEIEFFIKNIDLTESNITTIEQIENIKI